MINFELKLYTIIYFIVISNTKGLYFNVNHLFIYNTIYETNNNTYYNIY